MHQEGFKGGVVVIDKIRAQDLSSYLQVFCFGLKSHVLRSELRNCFF